MTLPAEVEFGTVTGLFTRAVKDTADVGTDPDGIPSEGQLNFTPDLTGGRLLVPDSTPPQTVLVQPVPVALVAGALSVRLVADDGTWTWTVSGALDGKPVAPFSFHVPAGETTDLTLVAPVATAAGGELYVAQAVAAAASAAISAAAAQAAADLVGAPADAAVAALLGNPASATSTELSSTYLAPAKMDNGGALLKPIRTPTLVVERSWPDSKVDYQILWASADGVTLYAVGLDSTLRKSVDSGDTWTAKATVPLGVGEVGAFLKTAANTLLTFNVTFPSSGVMIRSTDDGATWATVFTGPPNRAPLGVQSWCQDPITGYLYYGEYQFNDDGTQTTINVYRSTDDGLTWATFHTFPGIATAPGPNRVRHVHTVNWDGVQGRVVVLTGDDDPGAGMYRVNAGGTGLEPMLLNSQVTNLPAVTSGARAIAYIPFPDYIAYGGDTSQNPYIMRVLRTELVKPNPVVERVYRANSTVWHAAKASDDGSRWVICASNENPGLRLDTSAHLYSVEDQGATVTEIAALPAQTVAAAHISPIGQATNGGDIFFIAALSTGTGRFGYWRCRLPRGGTSRGLDWPPRRPRVYAWQTQSSGIITFPAGDTTYTFGVTKAPARGFQRLLIYDAGFKGVSGAPSGMHLWVWSGSQLLQVDVPSYRQSLNLDSGSDAVASFLPAFGAEVEFRLRNVSAASAIAYVTYGWGP